MWVQVEDAGSWWDRPEGEWGDGERLLACAATIMVELRAAVKAELKYTCSAGAYCLPLSRRLTQEPVSWCSCTCHMNFGCLSLTPASACPCDMHACTARWNAGRV